MKKNLARFLALVAALSLTLTLAACGGGASSGATSGSGGGNTPLTRDSSGQSSASQGGTRGGADPADTDFGAILGGGTDTIFGNFSAADKQALVEEGAKDGVDVTFGADGSTTFTYEDGSVVKQNADGTWDMTETDGSTSTIGGDWPDNEYTKQVPRPAFGIMAVSEESDICSIVFTDATLDQIRAYVEQLKGSGFTIGEETTDQEIMGMVLYQFAAKNAQGYEVEVISASGVVGLNIRKP